MKDERDSKSLGFRGVAIIAAAMGAVAVGALAIGALAIRRLAIGRIVVSSAEFGSLKVHDLTVTRLHAAAIDGSESMNLPESDVGHAASS